jgi:Ca2+-binding RTX toxin-like protein
MCKILQRFGFAGNVFFHFGPDPPEQGDFSGDKMVQLVIALEAPTNPLLSERIGSDHFGTNLLFNRDVDATGQSVSTNYASAIDDLGAKTFRYPGGTITESLFDLVDPFSSTQNYLQQQSGVLGQSATTLSLSGALDYAARDGLGMTIVLPSFRFLSDSSDPAGNRFENVDEAQVYNFVMRLLSEANSRGVPVQAIELGNEWYVDAGTLLGGRMTPIEYGRIASRLAEVTQSAIETFKSGLGAGAGWEEPQIIVQVGPGGELEKYTPTGQMVTSSYTGLIVSATELIFREFESAAERAAVDGLLSHRYLTNSDANINGWAYRPFETFTSLATSNGGFGSLDRYVTEWNVAARNSSELGLKHAGNLVQLFTEMLEAGVDHANIWAVQQNNGSKLSTSTGLSGSTYGGLTFGGEIFRLMNANLQGLRVAPTSINTNTASVSVFGNEQKVVLYISNETAFIQDFQLAIPSIANGYHHVWGTTLGAMNGDYANFNGRPEISISSSSQLVASNGSIDVILDPYEVIQVVFTIAAIGVEIRGFLSNDRLDGSMYADDISGLAGNDTLCGFMGSDALEGGAGNDTLMGGDGADTLAGGEGSDRLDGGAGRDQVTFANAKIGVTADLLSLVANAGEAAGDTLVSIEDVTGSNWTDVLAGDTSSNLLQGLDGADLLIGRGGNDTLEGGSGNDTLRGGAGVDRLDGGVGRDMAGYEDAANSVRVDLQFSQTNSGDASGDIFIGVEDLSGTAFGDVLAGDSASNLLQGMIGNDILAGRAGNDTLEGGDGADTLVGGAGSDLLDGGVGRDQASYWDSSSSVRVDIMNLLNNTGDALGDAFVSIEDITGSGSSDDIFGDANDNCLQGLAGNDVIAGRGGADVLEGGVGNDTLIGGAGADRLNGGEGRDQVSYFDALTGIRVDLVFQNTNTGQAFGDVLVNCEDIGGSSNADILAGDGATNALYGIAGDDVLAGRGGADWLEGGIGNDTLVGGSGGDQLFGGQGRDVASYWDAATGVVADLQDTRSNRGDAGGDTYAGIEDITGSAFKDTLQGDDFANVLLGLDGDDMMIGRSGDDTLDGGMGKDFLSGGSGNDLLFGGADADVFVFNEGRDTIVDFTNNVDEIQIDGASWSGSVRTVAELLQPDNVVVTALGLEISVALGHVIDIRGIFDVGILYDDISFI